MKGRLQELLDAGHGCWDCSHKKPALPDCGNHRCCLVTSTFVLRCVCTTWGPITPPAPDPRDRELEILRAQVRVLAKVIGDCVNDTVPECPSDLDECPLINQEDPCPVCADCFEHWSRRQAEKEAQEGSGKDSGSIGRVLRPEGR